MKKYPLVEVVWIDSAHHSAWRIKGALVEYSTCRTVGYRVPAGKGTVAVAMSVSAEGSFTETMAIPRVAVKSITKLR